MNDKQKKFCELYAASGNATEAAKQAGYSERTAYSQGGRLLKNVECKKYIKQLQEKAEAARIANISEVKETWTEILRDTKQKTRDRIRAGELIARASGDFIPDQKENDPAEDEDKAQQYAVVCLPLKDGETDFTAIQNEAGEVIPIAGHENDDTLIYMPYGRLYESISKLLEDDTEDEEETDE